MTQPQQPPPQPEPPPDLADSSLDALELAFYAIVLAAIMGWLGAVLAAVLRPFRVFGQVPDPTAVYSTVPLWTDNVKALIRWLERNAAPAGNKRFRSDYPSLRIGSLTSTDQFMRDHFAAVENYLVRLPDEVFDLMRTQLSTGVDKGESTAELAKRVQAILSVTSSENWPSRSKIVAITEVNGAANAAWLASALQAQRELGVTLNKVWISAKDSRVRPSHRAADGQTVPLLTPFIVGGFPLMYPGDKAGPPQEVIGCRCAAGTKETS